MGVTKEIHLHTKGLQDCGIQVVAADRFLCASKFPMFLVGGAEVCEVRLFAIPAQIAVEFHLSAAISADQFFAVWVLALWQVAARAIVGVVCVRSFLVQCLNLIKEFF